MKKSKYHSNHKSSSSNNMGDYSMKQFNELVSNIVNNKETPTEKEVQIREDRYNKLRSIGVYIGLYAEGIQFPTHPDGIHGYLTDAYEAKELIMSGKDLPQELLDRLAYYKPIIDKQLEER